MADIQQNTLYLHIRGSYLGRDHLTLVAEVPVYPPDLPEEERSREKATDWRNLSIPIQHSDSSTLMDDIRGAAKPVDLTEPLLL